MPVASVQVPAYDPTVTRIYVTFMSIRMTPQQVAEWILDILVKDLHLKPGDPVPDHQLKEKYRARKGDSADIKVGLKHAEEHEWLMYDPTTNTWHLTELGRENA
jgi:hypothetical protein